jgi:hypothetical protein
MIAQVIESQIRTNQDQRTDTDHDLSPLIFCTDYVRLVIVK